MVSAAMDGTVSAASSASFSSAPAKLGANDPLKVSPGDLQRTAVTGGIDPEPCQRSTPGSVNGVDFSSGGARRGRMAGGLLEVRRRWPNDRAGGDVVAATGAGDRGVASTRVVRLGQERGGGDDDRAAESPRLSPRTSAATDLDTSLDVTGSALEPRSPTDDRVPARPVASSLVAGRLE